MSFNMDPIFREEMTRKRKIIQISSQSTENRSKSGNVKATSDLVDQPEKVLCQGITLSQKSNSTQNAGTLKNLERLHNQVLTDGEFVSDDAITMAVEVLRQDTEQLNVFIANGLANLLIESWSSTAGWERFGKIFNSQLAVFSKPNGIYIIPMYRPGHWYLVVVQKINRNTNDGWILDSLRKGDPDTIHHMKIKEAFTGNRGFFNWHTPQCRPQTENECGPRRCKNLASRNGFAAKPSL